VTLNKPAETSRPIEGVIRDRWSPRAFTEQPVTMDQLLAVLEAGRWTASSNNVQPWRFIVATREDEAAHAKAVTGFGRNGRWAKLAPVLMFVLSRKTNDAGQPHMHSWYDAGAAGTTMMLQATAMGLVMHTAGGIDRDFIRANYGVPDDCEICTGIALGYQGGPELLPDDLAEREKQPRTRKPLSEIVFGDAYGTPAKLG
jgi:nitroreductase